MPRLLLPSRRINQFKGMAEIDKTLLDPAKLIAIITPEFPDINLVGNKPLVTSNITTKISGKGKCIYFSGGNNEFINLGPADSILDNTSYTLIVCGERYNAASYGGAAHGYDSTEAENRVLVHLPYPDGNIYFDYGNATTGRISVSGVGFFSAGIDNKFAFVAGDRGREVWRNGVIIGSDPSALAVRPPNSVDFRIGTASGVGSTAPFENTYFILATREQLSPATLTKLTSNPWQIFAPQKRVVYFDLVAGGAATLTGANSSQDNVSSAGAITQTHAVSGANASQANSSSTAGITQIHVLLGANATQANNSSAGAASQAHILTGANASQDSTSTTGSVTQTHLLTGANSAQANTSSVGAVILAGTIVLTGADSSQANTSATSAISQTHVLAGANADQVNMSAGDSVVQTHILTGADSSQANTSSAGVIIVGTVTSLTGANASQANLSSSAAITQFFTLSGANASQGNDSSAWAITQTHILVGSNASQANQSGTGGINGSTADSGAHFDWPVDYVSLSLSARVCNRIENKAAITKRIANSAKI